MKTSCTLKMSRAAGRIGILAIVLLQVLAGCGERGRIETSAPETSATDRNAPITSVPDRRAPESSAKSRNLAPGSSPSAQDTVVNGINALGLGLTAGYSGNVVVAPFSASLSLARLEAGANGDTRAALKGFMNLPGPATETYPALNQLDLGINSRIASATLGAQPSGSAARAWAQTRYGYLLTYLDTLVENFGLSPLRVDFDLAWGDADQVVNSWGAQASGFPTGVSITNDTRLVLGDALRLNASWTDPFDAAMTKRGGFETLSAQSSVPVLFMHKTATIPQGSGDGFLAFALPLQGSQQFLILLPDAGRFAEVRAALTSERLRQIAASLTPALVTLAIPKFTLKHSTSFDLGLASWKGSADFSSLDGTRDLYVSSTAHRSGLSITEAGLQAGSATLLALDDYVPRTWGSQGYGSISIFDYGSIGSAPKLETVVGRPFIFAVMDTATGTVLFQGQLVKPEPLNEQGANPPGGEAEWTVVPYASEAGGTLVPYAPH